MSIDEARSAMTKYTGQWLTELVDALARAVARDEFARLSPAPVGGEKRGPCSDKCMAGIECDNACRKKPTPPPAEPDGGEAGAEWLNVALEGRASYLSDKGEEKSPCLLRQAADRIAALEQRLAEAEGDLAAARSSLTASDNIASTALRDLAEARKRIGELEDALRDLQIDIPWVYSDGLRRHRHRIRALLLTPTDKAEG